jgi:hypothetical protein
MIHGESNWSQCREWCRWTKTRRSGGSVVPDGARCAFGYANGKRTRCLAVCDPRTHGQRLTSAFASLAMTPLPISPPALETLSLSVAHFQEKFLQPFLRFFVFWPSLHIREAILPRNRLH